MPPGWKTRLLAAWPLAIIVLALAWLDGGSILAHYRLFQSHGTFHDDVRVQVFPYFRYIEPAAWKDDYLGDYVLDFLSYPLYHWLYIASAWVWDPEALSKFLPYPLLLITAGALMVAAHRLGGWVAVFFCGALTLGSSIYLDRMAGGISRAFAFPILAVAIGALATGKLPVLRWAVWIGAGTYPMSAVPAGLAMALWMLVLPKGDRGIAEEWPFARRMRYLLITAGVGAALLLPNAIEARRYGRPLRPADVATYPEAGPAGTHGSEDRPPFPWYLVGAPEFVRKAITGAGQPILAAAQRLPDDRKHPALAGLFSIALLGFCFLALKDRAARRIAMFSVAAIGAQSLSIFVVPYFYHPQRYILFTVPVMAVLIAVAGPIGYLRLAGVTHRAATAGVALASGLCFLLLFGGRGDHSVGAAFKMRPDELRVYEAIAKLPPTAYVAGWPDDPMSSVPYLSRRKVLMSGEMHQALLTGYLEELRVRLKIFFEAYLATSPEPIARLRDELHVTHVMLELRHFDGPTAYMPPMGGWVADLYRRSRGRDSFEFMKQLPHMTVYRDARFAVVDLSKLQRTPPAPAEPPP